MRVTIVKHPDGTVTVRARRTRAWEHRVPAIPGIPRKDVGAAVGDLVKEMRDDHRPRQRELF